MLPEDKNKIESSLKEVDQIMSSDKLDSTKINQAKNILFELLETYKDEYKETDEKLKLNFANPIYYILANNILSLEKKVEWIDFPVSTIYNKLAYLSLEQKDFDNCEKYSLLVEKYSPLDLSGRFELIELYKITKEYKKIKKELFKLFPLIFSANDLAKFYRIMGYYYVEIKSYNIAYALMLESIKYEENKLAYDEMDYIRVKLNNPNFRMSYAQTAELLDEYNIPYGIEENNLKWLKLIYEKEESFRKKDNYFNYIISRQLYDLTADSQYILYKKYEFKDIGFDIELPFTWEMKEKPQEMFRENTLAAIVNESQYIMEVRNDGEITTTFEDKLAEIKKELINEKFEIVKEGNIVLKEKNYSPSKFEIIYVRRIDSQGKTLGLIEYVGIINNHAIRFISIVNPSINPNDTEAFFNQTNVKHLKRLLSLTFEVKEQKETEQIDLNNGLELLSQDVTHSINQKDLECSLTIPINVGSLEKTKENSYTIGDKIFLFVLNNNKDSVEAKADDWLINASKTTDRELLDKKEEYDIAEYHITEKYTKKPGFMEKCYKFLLFKNKILVFTFSYEKELSETVNKIISTLK